MKRASLITVVAKLGLLVTVPTVQAGPQPVHSLGTGKPLTPLREATSTPSSTAAAKCRFCKPMTRLHGRAETCPIRHSPRFSLGPSTGTI